MNNNYLKQTAEFQGMATAATQKIPLPGQNRQRSPNHLPERYTVKSSEDERTLLCLEAPNINVHIDAGLSISGSVVRKSPAGTIFLDGVAQCEPFMDHERQVYNLDHHEGCVRAFTLATCEQALVMYMKGLDLQSREWNIFANEPDLDTILAIWIILNHARIGQQDHSQRRILFSLIRYEGNIDALGCVHFRQNKEIIGLQSILKTHGFSFPIRIEKICGYRCFVPVCCGFCASLRKKTRDTMLRSPGSSASITS